MTNCKTPWVYPYHRVHKAVLFLSNRSVSSSSNLTHSLNRQYSPPFVHNYLFSLLLNKTVVNCNAWTNSSPFAGVRISATQFSSVCLCMFVCGWVWFCRDFGFLISFIILFTKSLITKVNNRQSFQIANLSEGFQLCCGRCSNSPPHWNEWLHFRTFLFYE